MFTADSPTTEKDNYIQCFKDICMRFTPCNRLCMHCAQVLMCKGASASADQRLASGSSPLAPHFFSDLLYVFKCFLHMHVVYQIHVIQMSHCVVYLGAGWRAPQRAIEQKQKNKTKPTKQTNKKKTKQLQVLGIFLSPPPLHWGSRFTLPSINFYATLGILRSCLLSLPSFPPSLPLNIDFLQLRLASNYVAENNVELLIILTLTTSQGLSGFLNQNPKPIVCSLLR